jgi:hypothetical protein
MPGSGFATIDGQRHRSMYNEELMSQETIRDIERAIRTLTPQEVEELYAWLDQHYPQAIDSRLASDLGLGRLDKAIQRALDDEEKGRTKLL